MNSYWITYKNSTGYHKEQVVGRSIMVVYTRFIDQLSPNELDNTEVVKIALEGED